MLFLNCCSGTAVFIFTPPWPPGPPISASHPQTYPLSLCPCALYICFLIHFELNFKKGAISVSTFFSFHGAVQLSSTICWKDYLCFIVLPCFFAKDQLTIHILVYFWTLYSISLIYLFILSPISHYLYYYSFLVSLAILLLQYWVGYSRSVASPYKL